MLGRGAGEQVLAHLASDLRSLFPTMHGFSLTSVGALYDQTQLLRPGFPVLQALENFSQRAGLGASPQPSRLLSIGAVDGRLPQKELQPEADIPPAALQLLPLLVSGATQAVTELAEAMEHRFMAEGQVSAHSAFGLAAAFGIEVIHARFMTLNDLLALLNLQLSHLGLLPLWELLDAALAARQEPLSVVGNHGQAFEWDGHSVRCTFESFDAFARRDPAEAAELPERYGAWVREYRQYLVTLAAHGVPITQYLPGQDTPLEGSFVVESVPWSPVPGACCVTEHSLPHLGVIAVSVASGDQLLHFYPLSAAGLDDLHRHIRDRGWASGGFAYPCRLLIDPHARGLAPDCQPEGVDMAGNPGDA